MKIGIFNGFSNQKTEEIENACKDLGIDYKIVDILSSDWIDNIKNSGCDGFSANQLAQVLKRNKFWMKDTFLFPNSWGIRYIRTIWVCLFTKTKGTWLLGCE